jgi:hypothetical protein
MMMRRALSQRLRLRKRRLLLKLKAGRTQRPLTMIKRLLKWARRERLPSGMKAVSQAKVAAVIAVMRRRRSPRIIKSRLPKGRGNRPQPHRAEPGLSLRTLLMVEVLPRKAQGRSLWTP